MIAFKTGRLHAVGAQTGSAQTAPGGRPRHPLKAASWVGVAVNLMEPDWPHALYAAGFDTGGCSCFPVVLPQGRWGATEASTPELFAVMEK